MFNMYMKIERVGNRETKILFSKNLDFGDDYILFETDNLYQDVDIYLFGNYELKVIGRKPLKRISNKEFQIKEFRVVHPKSGTFAEPYYSDSSFIKRPCAHISFSESMNDFNVAYSRTNETIYKASANLSRTETVVKILLLFFIAITVFAIVALKNIYRKN